jgi:hypothetical protein
MLHYVALVSTDILEERITFINRVTRIGELATILAITSNRRCCEEIVTLMIEAICSFETSVLKRATWHNIPEDGILLKLICLNV